jgi:hypothetical protein
MSIGKEVILHKARLGEKKNRLADLDKRAENCAIMIRDIFYPDFEDSNDLDLHRARLVLEDLTTINMEKTLLKAEIAKLERELHG